MCEGRFSGSVKSKEDFLAGKVWFYKGFGLEKCESCVLTWEMGVVA